MHRKKFDGIQKKLRCAINIVLNYQFKGLNTLTLNNNSAPSGNT
jgi:hypothetical protein